MANAELTCGACAGIIGCCPRYGIGRVFIWDLEQFDSSATGNRMIFHIDDKTQVGPITILMN